MKVWITGGDAFPIYEVYDSIFEYDNYDIDIETIKRWDKANEEFMKAQKEILEFLKGKGRNHWGVDDVYSFMKVDLGNRNF